MDQDDKTTVKVWDPFVRLFHWSVVALFAVSYITEGEPEWLHVWSGYGIAALVGMRIVWGIIGSRHARFSNFAAGPSAVFDYLRALVQLRAPRYLGHSPAGGAMAIALLVCLLATALAGMATLAVEEGEGPLAPVFASAAATAPVGEAEEGEEEHAEDHEGELFEEIHEILANVTLGLVIFHLVGIALASFAHRENLVKAMITGRKRVEP